MDIGRSITYVFQDPAWIKKVAIGGLLLFVPILGWLIVAGYFLRIIRQVASGIDLPLPEWDDFGGDLILGLKGIIAAFVWALPVMIISACVWIPLAIVGDGNGAAGAAAGGLAAAGYCLNFILSLALAFVMPLVYSRVATTDSVSAALDVSAIIAEARQYPVPLLIAVGMSYALGIAASLGFILCIVGVVFTSFLAYVMLSHLYGQIRRQIDIGTSPATVADQHPPV